MPQKLYLLGASVFALILSGLIHPDLTQHGLRTLYNPNGVDRLERIVLLTGNDGSVHPDSPLTVHWTGYLYLPDPAELYFRIPANVQAKLTLNNDIVFDTFTQPASADRAVSYPIGGFNAVTFEVAVIPNQQQYFQAGLEWETLFGWQLVPATHLYPQPVAEQQAQQTLQLLFWAQGLAGLGMLFGIMFAAAMLWQRRRALRSVSRTALGLALIVALAFTLRLVFLYDYAVQPAADMLGYGSDQRGYQSAALDYLRGHWPGSQAFYVQPGISFALGAIYALIGPNIRAIQILQMLLGALTSLLIFDVARRAFNERSGWIAALLWAIFPLPIFYEVQLLTHGLEPILGALILFLWVRALAPADSTQAQPDSGQPQAGRPQGSPLRWVIVLGLVLGIASIVRPTFLILAPLIAFTLGFKHVGQRGAGRFALPDNWRAMLGWPALLALATLLPILPITWHNYQVDGRFQLLNSSSDITLYLGNNRDSTGLGEYSPAYQATHTLVNQGKTTFFNQTVTDIRADPLRWLQLMARKTALYLGNPELPNNVDFYNEGAGISPLLAILPLRFGAMMALALAGAILSVRKLITDDSPPSRAKRDYRLLITTYCLSQLAITVLYHVFSRFRAPIYSVLAILGAYTLATIFSTLRQKHWRELTAALATLAAAGLFIAAMPGAAEVVMSRPVVSALPTTAKPLNAPLGESLALVGYEPPPVVAPGDPFFITLYWQSSQPIAGEVYATVQLFGGDLKVTQADQPIGTGSFPDYPTGQWQPLQIVRDTVFLRMPDDAPTPLALTLLVAAYDRLSGNRYGETTFGYLSLTRAERLSIPPDALPNNGKTQATVGTAILSAYALRDRTLTLYWQAGEPMAEDGVIFVHLFDANGSFITGVDSRPRNGLYSTLAWQKGEGIVDNHPLPSELPPGEYEIKIGMYDAATQSRLPVVNANGEVLPEGTLPLGTIKLIAD